MHTKSCPAYPSALKQVVSDRSSMPVQYLRKDCKPQIISIGTQHSEQYQGSKIMSDAYAFFVDSRGTRLVPEARPLNIGERFARSCWNSGDAVLKYSLQSTWCEMLRKTKRRLLNLSSLDFRKRGASPRLRECPQTDRPPHGHSGSVLLLLYSQARETLAVAAAVWATRTPRCQEVQQGR